MYRITINTRFNGATETRGETITAYVTTGNISKQLTKSYDYSLNVKSNHMNVAELLASEFLDGSAYILFIGETKSGRGYKFEGCLDA